jgi:hypothetical protein
MEIHIATWEIGRDQVKVSYTSKRAVLKDQIARWAMRWDHWIS